MINISESSDLEHRTSKPDRKLSKLQKRTARLNSLLQSGNTNGETLQIVYTLENTKQRVKKMMSRKDLQINLPLKDAFRQEQRIYENRFEEWGEEEAIDSLLAKQERTIVSDMMDDERVLPEELHQEIGHEWQAFVWSTFSHITDENERMMHARLSRYGEIPPAWVDKQL